MTRRAIAFSLFPTIILGLLIAERTATFLVGHYPASATFWWASLELRVIFRHFSNWFGELLGYSFALQILLLIAAIGAVCQLALARRSIWSFLANHAALLAAATSMVFSGGSIQANLGQWDRGGDAYLTVILQPTLLNGSLLLLGIASCAYCHFAFLSDARRRYSALSARLSELRHDF